MSNNTFVRTALALALAVAYGFAPGAALAAPATTAVSTATNQVKSWSTYKDSTGATVLSIVLQKPYLGSVPTFIGPSGEYVSIDLPNVALGELARVASSFDMAGAAKSVRWASSADRSRLVVNVAKGATYQTKIVGSTVLVTFTEPTVAGPLASGAPSAIVPLVPAAAGTAAVRDMGYKKLGGSNGEFTLELSDPGVKVRVYREGSNLALDLPNTALPRNLSKVVHYEALDTPIQAVTASSSHDGSTHVVLSARGGWDYTFAQNGKTLAITVIKVSDDYRVGGRKIFTGKKMSLSVQSLDVRAVLLTFADFTGLNVIASDTITGSMTLRLNEVPWDQALDLILSTRNLDMRRSGNVMWIAPKKEILEKETQDLAERKAQELAEPVVNETFQINYAKATAIKTLLENGDAGSKTGISDTVAPATIRVDDRSNQLFVKASSARLEEIRAIIVSVDVPVRQVSIEAKIIEVSDSFEKNLGINLGYSDKGSTGIVGFGTQMSPSFSVNLPATPGNGNPGTFGFNLFNSSLTRVLNLQLQALEADGQAKTVSSPHVVTTDNIEAVVSQGTQIPYLQSSSSGAATVAFKDATMSLKVKPQITPNGKVSLEVSVNKDSVGSNTAAGPAIDTKQVHTNVLVDNGGTIVIGGIFIEGELNNVNKIPFLGDIPFLGNAFKNVNKSTSRKELVIMITPRVIDSTGTAPAAQ
jgi:type IV pilus assembly protein PilQ